MKTSKQTAEIFKIKHIFMLYHEYFNYIAPKWVCTKFNLYIKLNNKVNIMCSSSDTRIAKIILNMVHISIIGYQIIKLIFLLLAINLTIILAEENVLHCTDFKN